MQLTSNHFYYSATAIEAALAATGEPAAHAKTMHMYRLARDIASITHYLKSYSDDLGRHYRNQEDTEKNQRLDERSKKESKIRSVQKIAHTTKQILIYRPRLKRLQAEFDRKIAKWPTLDINPDKLIPKGKYKRTDYEFSQALRRRSRRGSRVKLKGYR